MIPAPVPGRDLCPFPAIQGVIPAPFPAPCKAFPSASAAGASGRSLAPSQPNSHTRIHQNPALIPRAFPRQIPEHEVRASQAFPNPKDFPAGKNIFGDDYREKNGNGKHLHGKERLAGSSGCSRATHGFGMQRPGRTWRSLEAPEKPPGFQTWKSPGAAHGNLGRFNGSRSCTRSGAIPRMDPGWDEHVEKGLVMETSRVQG